MASLNVRYLKGVGEKRAKLLKKLGIDTVDSLLHYYPRAWRNYSDIRELYSAPANEPVSVRCRVTTAVEEQYIRNNMTIYRFGATDDSAYLQVTLFNSKFTAKKIEVGKTYIFYGKLTPLGAVREMSSPEILPDGTGITPIYPTTAGLYQSNLRTALKAALEHIPKDPLPEELRKKYKLCGIEFALRNIHFPTDKKSLAVAKYRLVFEELLMFRTGIAMKRRENFATPSWKCDRFYSEEFKALLPFELTDSQKDAINDCVTDMRSGKQMNRLVEGDVGSGKTAVAAALMYSVARCGRQCAMMAPTEILAEQHYNTLKSLFKDTNIKVEKLLGSLKKSEKDKIKKEIASGEISVIVGTQALLQSSTEFSSLSLVITDEQHRFGVAQRARLEKKGNAPHMLIMSATPIPRTLALILYGDLDISVMKAMPRGRIPIETYIAPTKKREGIYEYIKRHIALGRQAYIVCPLVEEGENTALLPAKQYYEQLKSGPFANYSVGLLHGKQKAKEKEQAMRDFAEGKTQLLITTTVVEVGVDVPNATVMVIENAERFGLSQLHQLRGRVGRGSERSSCILVTSTQNEETLKRLNVIKNSTDGFKIANEDLRLRGPGDFLGNRQHGLPQFKIADISCNMDILKTAGFAADEVLQNDLMLEKAENLGIKYGVDRLFNDDEVTLN